MKRFTVHNSLFTVFALFAVGCLLLSVLYGCGGSASPTDRYADTAAKGGKPGKPPKDGGGGTPPTGEAIVFTASGNVIKTINPDGTGEFEVTKSGFPRLPSWSPDGSEIAFSAQVQVGKRRKDQSLELFIINGDGTSLTQLTNTPDFNENDPELSPAGDKIVFRGWPEGAELSEKDIWLMNADGTGLQNLTNSPGVSDTAPTWSPDGTQIAWASDDPNARGFQVFVMNADGSSPVQVTGGKQNCSPAWSPDGTRIAFASGRDGNEEIYVLHLDLPIGDPGGEVNLSNNPASDGDPAWSPDGSKIAFNSSRGGEFGWGYVMDAHGSGVQLIYDGYFGDPDWRAAPTS